VKNADNISAIFIKESKMARKIGWLGTLVMVLLISLMIIGCRNNSNNAETEIWSDVTSFNQLEGTWEQLSSLTFPVREDEAGTWYSELENYKLTFDANAKTLSVSRIYTDTYSGGNTEIWELWKETWESSGQEFTNEESGEYSYTFNELNHSITSVSNNLIQTLTDELIIEIMDSLKINQKGTKLKETVDGIDIILHNATTM
jgi:hypothetical protein